MPAVVRRLSTENTLATRWVDDRMLAWIDCACQRHAALIQQSSERDFYSTSCTLSPGKPLLYIGLVLYVSHGGINTSV